MSYYKTKDNFPKFTNCPMPDDIEINETEYKRLCDENNAEAKRKEQEAEAQAKDKREREKLIHDRMYKIAEQELIKEGIIEEE